MRLATRATKRGISEEGAVKEDICIVYIKSVQHSLFPITTQLLGKKQFAVPLAPRFFLKIMHTGKRNVRFDAIILLS